MELEVVLRADQEEGAAIADALVEQLGITADSLIRTAYLDLLKDGARPPDTFKTGEE
jgi:adenylate cyclase class IV